MAPLLRAEGFGGVVEHGEAAAVGLLQISRREDFGSGAGRDHAHIQEDDVLVILRHGAEVVMDDEHGVSA